MKGPVTQGLMMGLARESSEREPNEKESSNENYSDSDASDE